MVTSDLCVIDFVLKLVIEKAKGVDQGHENHRDEL